MAISRQLFAGLPRLAKNDPCKSAAFLRMPARFIASVRSGAGFIMMEKINAAAKALSVRSPTDREM